MPYFYKLSESFNHDLNINFFNELKIDTNISDKQEIINFKFFEDNKNYEWFNRVLFAIDDINYGCRLQNKMDEITIFFLDLTDYNINKNEILHDSNSYEYKTNVRIPNNLIIGYSTINLYYKNYIQLQDIIYLIFKFICIENSNFEDFHKIFNNIYIHISCLYNLNNILTYGILNESDIQLQQINRIGDRDDEDEKKIQEFDNEDEKTYQFGINYIHNEDFSNDTDDMDFYSASEDGNENYFKKYLKYKIKYLKLKNN
jgi:hypothetical protein